MRESRRLLATESDSLLGLSMRPWLQSLHCFHAARPAKNRKWSWNTFWLTMFCHPITLHLKLDTMRRNMSGQLKGTWVLKEAEHWETANSNPGWKAWGVLLYIFPPTTSSRLFLILKTFLSIYHYHKSMLWSIWINIKSMFAAGEHLAFGWRKQSKAKTTEKKPFCFF